jgi:hypothetical protein
MDYSLQFVFYGVVITPDFYLPTISGLGHFSAQSRRCFFLAVFNGFLCGLVLGHSMPGGYRVNLPLSYWR